MRALPLYLNAWRQHPLFREITVILAVKLVLIFMLWWWFFHLPSGQRINTSQVSAHVAGASPPAVSIPEEKPK